VRASLDVLEALARALRLTPAERTHLVLLGRGEEPPPRKVPEERVSPTVRRIVETLGPNPVYILGRYWDYLAWNDAAVAVFGDFGSIPRASRNHVWITFMDPARRQMHTDWENASRVIVAKMRADSARLMGDPAFDELVRRLRQCSPEFAAAWTRHEVTGPGAARKKFRHPTAGLLVFDHAIFQHVEAPEQRLVLFSPVAEHDTPAKLARLMGS
jgi:hypothetical protein